MHLAVQTQKLWVGHIIHRCSVVNLAGSNCRPHLCDRETGDGRFRPAYERNLAQAPAMAVRQKSHLLKEWHAIRKNKAFGPRFDVWVLAFHPFGQLWVDLPPSEWVHDVYQLARHVCDATAKQEARRRRDRFKYVVQLDVALNGQKQGFARPSL